MQCNRCGVFGCITEINTSGEFYAICIHCGHTEEISPMSPFERLAAEFPWAFPEYDQEILNERKENNAQW